MLRLACVGFVVLLTALVLSPVLAGPCKPARYQVMGVVLDASGRPIVDARIYLLLDEVSEQKTSEYGVRAVPTRTNPTGSYVQLIDCEELAKTSDRPNPCAKNPRHLTVSAGAPGQRTKVQVFKFKSLEIRKDPGGCVILVPDIKLSPGP